MRMLRTAVALGASTAAILASAGPALADSGDARLFSVCDAGSTFELVASPANGDMRISLKVSTPFTDRDWTTTITDNDVVVVSDTRFVTGSFSYDVKTVDQPGTDTITIDSAFGSATCHGSVTI